MTMTSSVLVQEKILVIVDLFYLDFFTLNILFYLFLLDMINRKRVTISQKLPVIFGQFHQVRHF